MAITVDWDAKIINIPKADTTLIQASPTEIRELDLNAFRLTLRDLEDDAEGMPFETTHEHNTAVTVGGVDLARVVQIINGYTVTFENGTYAVNLIGANSNVGDRVNVNNVSVRSANSAGLVTSAAIEFGEYGGAVHVDQTGSSSGSIYPLGTLRSPVNNIADAMVIANARGFSVIKFLNPTVTISSGDDVEEMTLEGKNPTLTDITIDPGALTARCTVKNATVRGTLDGNSTMLDCCIEDLDYVNGTLDRCTLTGVITLAGGASAHMTRCFSGIPGSSTPTIDMGGSGQSLSIRGYNGGVTLRDKSGPESVSIDLNAGQVILESTVTQGTIILRGAYKLTDNSTGTAVVNTEGRVAVEQNASEFRGTGGTSLSPTDLDNIADAVWDEAVGDHQTSGSTGKELRDAKNAANLAFATNVAL